MRFADVDRTVSGVGLVRLYLLWRVAQAPLSQRDLGDALRGAGFTTTNRSVAQILRGLIRAGYIRTGRGSREVGVELRATALGRKAVERLPDRLRAILDV